MGSSVCQHCSEPGLDLCFDDSYSGDEGPNTTVRQIGGSTKDISDSELTQHRLALLKRIRVPANAVRPLSLNFDFHAGVFRASEPNNGIAVTAFFSVSISKCV